MVWSDSSGLPQGGKELIIIVDMMGKKVAHHSTHYNLQVT